MAPNWSMGNSYSDDRRGSGTRWDPPSSSSSSYRPADRERPPPPRRDSRDLREPPRPPHIDTSARPPEDPRKLSGSSPASAVGGLANGLQFKRMNAASEKQITTSSPIRGEINDMANSIIPKAKDTDLQEPIENVHKLVGKCIGLALLSSRKSKAVRESAIRQLESEKFQKQPTYAPFHGLGHKSSAAEQALDEEIKVAQDDYLHELEQVVAFFTTSVRPAVNNRQDPVITALEAKVEQISRLAAKQSEQIQRLLEENDSARNSYALLETGFSSTSSCYQDLEARHRALESEHQALQSTVRSYDGTILALQSKQASIDTENQSLKQQLRDLQSATEKKFALYEGQLAELAKRSSDSADSDKTLEKGLEHRITSIEAKLHDYDESKEKLDELDLVVWNQISEAWEEGVYTLKAQYEEFKEFYGQQNTSISDAIRPIRTLRQDLDSLQTRRPNIAQIGNGSTLSIQDIEDVVRARIAAAEQAINDNNRAYTEKKDELYTDLLGDVETRLDALERGTLDHSKKLADRLQLLEQWKVTGSARMEQVLGTDVSERLNRLESQRISHRVDRIDIDVGNLSQKCILLSSEVVRLQELLNGGGANPALVNDIQELRRKSSATELAIKTLDTQFQNLSTKQLAEYIIRLTNPTFEERLGKLEVKAKELRGRIDGHDKPINTMTDFLRSIAPGDKRMAAPNFSDEPSKKRKLETNGRHPSPLQQQQR